MTRGGAFLVVVGALSCAWSCATGDRAEERQGEGQQAQRQSTEPCVLGERCCSGERGGYCADATLTCALDFVCRQAGLTGDPCWPSLPCGEGCCHYSDPGVGQGVCVADGDACGALTCTGGECQCSATSCAGGEVCVQRADVPGVTNAPARVSYSCEPVPPDGVLMSLCPGACQTHAQPGLVQCTCL